MTHSSINKSPNSRDEPVLCLHIADNLTDIFKLYLSAISLYESMDIGKDNTC